MNSADNTVLKARSGSMVRKTRETEIQIRLDLDGSGSYAVETGIPFFNHMLEQLALHGGFDLEVRAAGDIEVDVHHIVEDTGILLGKLLEGCLTEKSGITRYGSMLLPMDDSLCMAVVDICGRANLVYNCSILKGSVGGGSNSFDVQVLEEFFKAFVSHAFITLHINLMYGSNTHHNAECIFKAVARALRAAVRREGRNTVPSTKGCLNP